MNALPSFPSDPLISRPGEVAVMPLRYYGSVGHYALLSRFPEVFIDCRVRFDKLSLIHI